MEKSSFPLFPEAASEFAKQVDWLYFYLTAVSVFFTVLIVAVIVLFSVIYRRKSDADRPTGPHHNLTLEIVWSVIPFILSMVMFVWGADLFFRSQRPPDDAMEILVTGKQWMWKVQHPSGKREINDLHIPVDTPVKFTITSEDVLHSYWIPAFRVKMDAVPGRYTMMWAEPNKIGQYHMLCAEYCGTEHSRMIGEVYVMSQADYQAWADWKRPAVTGAGSVPGTGSSAGIVSAAPPAVEGEDPMVTKGRQLFVKYTCYNCHAEGSQIKAPPLGGLYMKERTFTDKTTAVADDNYLKASIYEPLKQVVDGYLPVMVPWKGIISEGELQQIIAYIKSLKEGDPVAKP